MIPVNDFDPKRNSSMLLMGTSRTIPSLRNVRLGMLHAQ